MINDLSKSPSLSHASAKTYHLRAAHQLTLFTDIEIESLHDIEIMSFGLLQIKYLSAKISHELKVLAELDPVIIFPGCD